MEKCACTVGMPDEPRKKKKVVTAIFFTVFSEELLQIRAINN